ncbi:MAG: manganese efflux pump MntP family protein [Bacteroidales bacterium]|jgi:putative Mn2+ efflux pump MntP|nr:manganese efflux pump MntP family protein [Bacteroidales bacterium]
MITFLFSSILLGLALSIDSFAVSITCGLQKTMTRKRAFILAISFAFFQGLLPLIGAMLGNFTKEYISTLDHWIAFGLLAIIGIKMFLEGLKYDIKKNIYDFTKPSILLMLSLATSIDSFIAGIGFSLEYSLNEQIITVIIIFLSTFILSLVGVFMGQRTYFFKPKIALMLGGAILFGIGLKTFLQHTLI